MKQSSLGSKVKAKGHTMLLKIDLEVWRRRQSWSLGSNSFSSFKECY